MKVHIKINVRNAVHETTLFDGGPEDDNADLAGLLAEACRAVLAAEAAA